MKASVTDGFQGMHSGALRITRSITSGASSWLIVSLQDQPDRGFPPFAGGSCRVVAAQAARHSVDHSD